MFGGGNNNNNQGFGGNNNNNQGFGQKTTGLFGTGGGGFNNNNTVGSFNNNQGFGAKNTGLFGGNGAPPNNNNLFGGTGGGFNNNNTLTGGGNSLFQTAPKNPYYGGNTAFGQNKPLFGQPSNTGFGNTNNTFKNSPSLFQPKVDGNTRYYSISAHEQYSNLSFEEIAYQEYQKENGIEKTIILEKEEKKVEPKNNSLSGIDENFILQNYFIQTKEKIFCDFCNEEDANQYCNKCKKSCCSECLEFIHRKGEKKQHLEKNITKLENLTLKCHLHRKELIAFCTNCSQFACLSCVLQNGWHSKHKVISIEEAEKEIKELTTKNLENIKPMAESLKKRNESLTEQQHRLHKIVDYFFDSQIDLVKKMESQIETISKTEQSEATNFPTCIQLMRMDSEKEKTMQMDYKIIQSMIEESFETKEKNYNFVIHCKDCLGKQNEKSCLKCFLKDHTNHEMFYISFDDEFDCSCQEGKIKKKLDKLSLSDEKSSKTEFTFGKPTKKISTDGSGFNFSSISSKTDESSTDSKKLEKDDSSERSKGFSFDSLAPVEKKSVSGFSFGSVSSSPKVSSTFGSSPQTSSAFGSSSPQTSSTFGSVLSSPKVLSTFGSSAPQTSSGFGTSTKVSFGSSPFSTSKQTSTFGSSTQKVSTLGYSPFQSVSQPIEDDDDDDDESSSGSEEEK
eukprot:gene5357-9165_t